MNKRTITIGSIGKMLGITGWKLGWCLGPSQLIHPIWMAHQYINFCVATPLQEAAAVALKEAQNNGFFQENAFFYQKHCHALNQMLLEAGIKPIHPQGGYFTIADISKVPFEDNIHQCQYLTSQVGVTPIPLSPFYHHDAPLNLARFAYCKDMATLELAGKRLKRL